jgi:Icc protein
MVAIVLQLSDIHLTGHPGGPVSGYDPDARLRTVLDAWRDRGQTPDLALVTGDNTDDGSVEGYRRLLRALEPLDAPVLAVAGNHDRPTVMAEVFGASTEAEVGAWRIVGVDSSRPAQVHGTVDVAATTARLDALAAQDRRPTVLAIHHAPSPPSTNPWFQLDGAGDLLDELRLRPQVQLVVSGHLHLAFEVGRSGGPTLLGAPSTIMGIAHDGDRYEIGAPVPTGGRILTLGDDGTWSSELLVA